MTLDFVHTEADILATTEKHLTSMCQAQGATSGSVGGYVKRLTTYLRCPPECLVVGLALCRRYLNTKEASGEQYDRSEQALLRAFLTASVIGIKTHCDEFQKMQYYAYVGGVPPAVFNRMELDMMLALNFDLHVDTTEFLELASSMEVTNVTSPKRVPRFSESPLASPDGLSPETLSVVDDAESSNDELAY